MATREVLKVGDETLRKISRPVEKFDEKLAMLLDDMYETMKKEDGCGLAAPQVGILRRIFITDDGNGKLEFINPVILKESKDQLVEVEGCLSVGKRHGTVARPKKLKIEAYDRYGKKFELKAEGYLARIICHENDHLDGVLFIDKIIEER